MKDWAGDIWDRFGKSFIVVPVNIGWKRGRGGYPGANVMGAGVAKEAAERVPELPMLYGEFCAMHREKTPVTFDLSTGLVLFPTKPLGDNPAMSWRGSATLDLVKRSAEELADMKWMNRSTIRSNHDGDRPPLPLEDDDVYVPLVGCGNGGLDAGQVVPLLKDILQDDRFLLVQYRPF